jgi:hypothetical protein
VIWRDTPHQLWGLVLTHVGLSTTCLPEVRIKSVWTHQSATPAFLVGRLALASVSRAATASKLSTLQPAGPTSQLPDPSEMHQGSRLRQYGPRMRIRMPGSPSGRCRYRSLWTTSRLHSYSDTLPNLRIGNHTRVIFQGFTGKLVGDYLLPGDSE